MLIDPSGKKIAVYVEDWSSNIVTNEFIDSNDLAGYIHSVHKGSVRKFKCNGTISNEPMVTIKYLESISFDDVTEISIDINQDFCDIQQNKETIEGYISITTFNAENIGVDVYNYSMDGYFFSKDEFTLQQLSSYFGMGQVSGSESGITNDSLSVSLSPGTWGSGGIVVSALGGQSFRLIPPDLADCTPVVYVSDNGDNVCKLQVMTMTPDNDPIDISYIVVNRGGFKLESNVQWDIEILNATYAFYYDETGVKRLSDIITNNKVIGSSVTCISTGVSIISSNSDFTANAVGSYKFLRTKMNPGNVITIASSNGTVVAGTSTGGTIPVGANCDIVDPAGGELFNHNGSLVAIPIEFSLNDASRVQSIKAQLCTGYTINWTFSNFIDQVTANNVPTTIDLKYKYGGRIVCYFPMSSAQMFAGVRLVINHGGWTEYAYCPSCFSIDGPGVTGYGSIMPIAANLAKKNAQASYPIFQTSDMIHGIYDLYFEFSVAAGACCIDMGLYISNLQNGFSDNDFIANWRNILDATFVTSNPANIPAVPSYDVYNSIDYGGGGINYRMIGSTVDPNSSSTAVFRRTVFVDPSAGSHIHAIIRNIGSGQITGFTVKAVPLFSYNDSYKFVGDYSLATTPNVKNSILVPV